MSSVSLQVPTARPSLREYVGGMKKPGAFWFGTALIFGGFGMALPMYFDAGHSHYMLYGMGVSGLMIAAMCVMTVGTVIVGYALFPSISEIRRRRVPNIELRAEEGARMTKWHIIVVVAMTLAVAIDFEKSITMGFIVPGFRAEYHLSAAMGALEVLSGIAGTAIGSLAWGWMGDRVGRRAALLFTSLFFITSSSCGSMAHWQMNIADCGLMGIASGGLLPVALAFMAEILPKKHRGWLLVVIGGELGLAYAITSWLATGLIPDYSWRAMWLIGAPFGAFLLLLSLFAPESPRFLLTIGKKKEAEDIMRRYAMKATPMEEVAGKRVEAGHGRYVSQWSALFRDGLAGRTAALSVLGFAAGVINYGFILWLPVNLHLLGYSPGDARNLLADASLISLPAIGLLAVMYSLWSSKKTMIIAAVAAAVVLGVLAAVTPGHSAGLEALIVVVLCANSGLYATLAPYSAEIYPTHIRGQGTGMASGWGRGGGLITAGLLTSGVAAPGIGLAALIAAIPSGAAALALGGLTSETRKQTLADLEAA